MEHQIHSPRWEPYADGAEHYSYVRCLDLGKLYEVVRVTHDQHGWQAEFVHQVIFMDEYDEPALTKILKGFGYENLDAFVREVNGTDADPSELVIRQDGSINRTASPSWWIDYMLLASLMAEHFHGRTMTVQAADDLARMVLKANPTTPSPFCIYRTFLDQMLCIPLLETEINTICTMRDEQSRTAYLREEIGDLDEDDPCFCGRSQKELLDDAAFIAAVQKRWWHYNGNGGDPTENLREAIQVTVTSKNACQEDPVADGTIQFRSIKKKIHQTGFDEICQAGTTNIFHPMNIVCQSQVLNLQFWICADGGYGGVESYHITSRQLDDCNAKSEYTYYKTQAEVINGLETIRMKIVKAKHLRGTSVANDSVTDKECRK